MSDGVERTTGLKAVKVMGGLVEEDRLAYADIKGRIAAHLASAAVAVDAGAATRIVAAAAEFLPDGTDLAAADDIVEAARAVARAMTLAEMLHERIAFEVELSYIGRFDDVVVGPGGV